MTNPPEPRPEFIYEYLPADVARAREQEIARAARHDYERRMAIGEIQPRPEDIIHVKVGFDYELYQANKQREEAAKRPRFPTVIGNALILADGTAHQLRLLDKLYLRCGITTVDKLVKAYAP